MYAAASSLKTKNCTCQTLLMHSPAWMHILRTSVSSITWHYPNTITALWNGHYWTFPFKSALCVKTHVTALLALTRFVRVCLMRLSLSCFQMPFHHPCKGQTSLITCSHFSHNTRKCLLIHTAPWLLWQGAEQHLRRPSPLLLFRVCQCVSK